MSGALPDIFSMIANLIITETHIWFILLIFWGSVIMAYFVMRGAEAMVALHMGFEKNTSK